MSVFTSPRHLTMTASEQRPFAGAFAHKSPLNDDFASFAKKTMDKWKVPGLSIAVIDDEDIYAEVRAHPVAR